MLRLSLGSWGYRWTRPSARPVELQRNDVEKQLGKYLRWIWQHACSATIVNGHEVLPSGGREISPYAVMSSAPLAVMRFPQSRESGWV
jgi:hypothetical protein